MSIGSKFVFLGSRFAAEYPEGSGNFSVPLQWALGLLRLKREFVWVEFLLTCKDPVEDLRRIRIFERRMHEMGLGNNYCLIFQKEPEENSLETLAFYGIEENDFYKLLKPPNILLNLCHSIRSPLVERFDKRILCDLDPGVVPYWMTEMEFGQSSHHEFWTIGLNINSPHCRLPKQSVPWRTFFPLVDTEFNRPIPRPQESKFTTIGQWYWKTEIPIEGGWRDLSKGAVFEKFLELPQKVPHAHMELAMNMLKDDVAKARLKKLGWKLADPHKVARTPAAYRKYLAGALAEFTVVKGVETYFQTGWISDRAAAFLAMGRPVITEDTGLLSHLPQNSGMFFVSNVEEAAEAVNRVIREWDYFSKRARESAVKYFDSAKTLKRILG